MKYRHDLYFLCEEEVTKNEVYRTIINTEAWKKVENLE